MTENNKKMIIISSILAGTIILLLILMLLGVNLYVVNIPSVSSLIEKYNMVKKSEKELSTVQGTYYTTVNNLENAKNDYNKQKNKYNSLSDETINVIKEATTEESYNLEYMWIKLGNYAKKNNLEIVMVEPGGQQASSSNNKSNSTSADNKSQTTTTTTTTTTNTNSNTNSNSNTNTNTNTKDSTSNSRSSNSTNLTDSSSKVNSSDSVLKIEIKGSYMNISDFIFEVENDTALRFKLDNISMDYVEGTTVKASFDVKNIVVNK